MNEELKKALEEIKSAWKQFQDADARMEGEIKQFGEATQETKNLVATINARIDEIEAKFQRSRVSPAAVGGSDVPEFHQTYRKDVFDALRNLGLGNDLTMDQKSHLYSRNEWTVEMKALATDNDTAAGFLAPPEYAREIIKGIIEMSPLRGLANVRTTSAKALQIPKRTGTAAAIWIAERAQRDETQNPKWGMEEITAHEMHADIRVTHQQLEDSVFNLEAEIRSESIEQFAVSEAAAFITGDGVGKPEGILSNVELKAAAVASGDANKITGDSLIEIFFALKDSYARNATWLLKRSTLKTIRQFKDLQGQYMWAPGIAGTATPATILDRPYAEAVDMPAVAANAYPVAFGDFRRGYTIVDRVQMNIQKLVELHAQQGMVGYLSRKRVGGQVTLSEAIKLLQVKA